MFAGIGSVMQLVNILVKSSRLVDTILHFYQTTRRGVKECSIVTVMTSCPSGRTVYWLGGIASSNPAGNVVVFLSCELRALLGGDLCERPITLTEVSYTVCVCVGV